jgi:CheY-like chemotaxis protein
VLAKNPTPRRRLRIVVLNDSAPVFNILCQWPEPVRPPLRHDATCEHAPSPRGSCRFIQKHRPDVVIYNVGMPFASSWDMLEVIRTLPALQSQPFVITTPNKRKLEHAFPGRGRCL